MLTLLASAGLFATAGCQGPDTTPHAAVTATAPGTSTPTNRSADDTAWLAGIKALHTSMDAVPQLLEPTTMRTFGDHLAGCTHDLDQLGLPSERLRPAADLARQGCREYEKGAPCFATAASLGVVVAGSADDRKHQEAITCALAAVEAGSRDLAEAEGKAIEIVS
jgi:hypothetical protein